MSKTMTIKQRAIYVYLPSIEMIERWKKLAKKQGTSISKFVAEHVENSLRQEDEPGYKNRARARDFGAGARLREPMYLTATSYSAREVSIDNFNTAAWRLTQHTPLEPNSKDSISAVNINDLARVRSILLRM